jgi:hypothetical protein
MKIPERRIPITEIKIFLWKKMKEINIITKLIEETKISR